MKSQVLGLRVASLVFGLMRQRNSRGLSYAPKCWFLRHSINRDIILDILWDVN